MRNRLRQATRSGNFSLTGRGEEYWNSLPWKSIDVSDVQLGEYDDAVFFGLEELDGNAFLASKSKNQTSEDGKDGAVADKKSKKDKKNKKRKLEEPEPTADSEAAEEAEVDNSKEVLDFEEVAVVAPKSKKQKKEKKEKKEKAPVSEENEGAEEDAQLVEPPQDSSSAKKATTKKAKKAVAKVATKVVEDIDLSETDIWGGITLNALLCRSLHNMDFVKPTPIQLSAIPKILGTQRLDIVGVAETGSGKTLVCYKTNELCSVFLINPLRV